MIYIANEQLLYLIRYELSSSNKRFYQYGQTVIFFKSRVRVHPLNYATGISLCIITYSIA